MWKLFILLLLCFVGFMTWTAYLWFSLHNVIRDLQIKIYDLLKQITHLSSQNRSLREEFKETKERVEILMRALQDKLPVCSSCNQKESARKKKE